jgi:hypothetical protein
MSRFKFWTIVAGSEPTAFRASDPNELLPTLRQLQRHQPDAAIRWFEQGRLWASPEEAEAERQAAERTRRARDQGWRPGGAHRDPRERFKKPRDERRPAMLRRLRAKADRHEGAPARKDAPGRPESTRPSERRPWDRPPRRPRSAGNRPDGQRQDRMRPRADHPDRDAPDGRRPDRPARPRSPRGAPRHDRRGKKE